MILPFIKLIVYVQLGEGYEERGIGIHSGHDPRQKKRLMRRIRSRKEEEGTRGQCLQVYKTTMKHRVSGAEQRRTPNIFTALSGPSRDRSELC